MLKKYFEKVKIMKTPSGDLNSRLTDSCNILTHCTTLLCNSFGKENIYEIILDFDRNYVTI